MDMTSHANHRVLALDGGGRVIAVSAPAARSLGVDPPRLVGREVWDIAVPARRRDRSTVRRHGAGALDALLGRTVEVKIRREDGSTRPAHLRLEVPHDSEAAYTATWFDSAPVPAEVAATRRDPEPGAQIPSDGAVAAAPETAPEAAPAATHADAAAPAETLEPATERFQRRLSAHDERIAEALAGASASSPAAVLRVRVIDLPLVTAALGRPLGDELLAEVGRIVADALPNAVVAPVAGGDICVVLNDLPRDAIAAARKAATHVLERLSTTAHVAGEELRLHSAIGIAVAPRHGTEPPLLLTLAERAARPADGVDAACARVAALVDSDLRDLLRLRTRLEGVTGRQELRLFYQPIFDLQRSVPYGVEALLRWEDPELGLIPPNEFVPVAEQTGAIDELGGWVVEELCRHAAGWRSQGVPLQLHFNASALELRRQDFATRLLSTIHRHDLSPEHFTLEITESAVMLDAGTVLPTLRRLRGKGVQIAIDDFGSGHSSLSRLKDLPADILKIDRALVSGLPHDRASRVMVTAALEIAEALSMLTVAEGIETEGQRRMLMDLGCPLGQGFTFGRPAAPEGTHLSQWAPEAIAAPARIALGPAQRPAPRVPEPAGFRR